MENEKISARDTLKAAEEAEKQGDLAVATYHYGQMLSAFPNHQTSAKRLKRIHKKLGGGDNISQLDVNNMVGLIQAGHMAQAAEIGTRLAVIAPKEPVVHNFLGIALMQLGDFRRADQAFRAALKLRPDYVEAMGNLGSLLVDIRKPKEALVVLNRAITLKPDYAEGLNSAGLALVLESKLVEALAMFDRAIRVRPNYVNAINSKGVALKEMVRYDEAIETYLSGLKFAPDNQELLTNLAYAYVTTAQHDKALAILDKVSELNPDNAEVIMRRGIIFGEQGDSQRAAENISRALDVAPDMAEAHRSLTVFQKSKPGDAHIDQMKDLFERSAKNPDARMRLGFALGKALEDTGDLKSAFTYWKVGNHERQKLLSYSIDADKALFAKVKQRFSKAHFDSYAGYQNPTEQPMFIVGMMRSGTTLVEQIMASQGQVFGADELNYINNFVRADLGFLDGAFEFPFERFATGYLDSLVPEAKASPRFTDKLPVNFLWIGLIKTVFPNARIINLRRDPRDVALSIYKNYFDNFGNGYSYDLEDIAEFFKLYLDIMEHWRTVLPGQIYDIHYENVVSDLEGEARKLLAFCNLDWNDKILDFHTTKRRVKTASISQVREPIYRSSLRKWEAVADEMAPFIDVMSKAGALPD